MLASSALDAHRHPGSYVDPAGAVYELDGKILRGIQPAFTEFYASLLSNPAVRGMIGQRIVETAVASDTLAGYSLTLEHRRLAPLSFCYEWPPQMLRAAALPAIEALRSVFSRVEAHPSFPEGRVLLLCTR